MSVGVTGSAVGTAVGETVALGDMVGYSVCVGFDVGRIGIVFFVVDFWVFSSQMQRLQKKIWSQMLENSLATVMENLLES